ncbi:MAG TPA: TIGR00159 family protein [Ruminococcaceae bacterium]|nr:diadenylate cyclase CdaA [Oscillospiraceae bacterium]HCB65784.1 TIGR00159 family protein [Oscillospiraceae bacterium]
MISFSDAWLNLVNVFKSFRPTDVLDILITSFLVYKLITWAKVTRTGQLVKGLLALVVAYFLADWMQLQTMKYAMQYLFSNGLILLAVIFQPELRTALERVGRSRISQLELFSHQEEKSADQQWRAAISAICEAAPVLSRQKTGALMVIERKSRLGEIIKTGTIIDSVPSMELIGNIFFHNSPLHDGAMILRDGKLYAAGCFLPLSDNYDISKQLGTRHRAALGMSENSDALVIVVSEENGVISVALEGKLTRGYDAEMLRELLEKTLLPEKKSEDKKPGFWRAITK